MKSTYKKYRITLRQKAIFSIFLIYAILTSYFLYFTIVNQHHAAEEEILNAAKTEVNLISVAVAEYILRKDETFLQGFVKSALGNRDIEYILLAGLEGNVLAEGGVQLGHILHLENLDREVGVLAKGSVELGHTVYVEKGSPIVQEIGEPEGLLHTSGHIFYICMPIVHKGNDVGEIHLGINTVRVNQRLARDTYRGIAFIIITILTGSLLTYFLERRLRGSLKNLIQTTGRMAQGDLTQHVEIDIGDEVEELGESFNRMAQALAEKEKELTVARNTMVSMFNGITAGLAYISSDHEIIHANRAYEALQKDITRSSSSGEGIKCFEFLWQRQDICKNCPGESAMKTGKPKDLEREIILKNGERHVLWVHAYPVEDPGKNPAGFVEYIMDITQQRKLEDELKTYTEHLEEISQERARKLKEAHLQIVHQEKMAALGQMAAGVAHEIGNPLSALSSLVRALEIDLRNQYSNGKIKVMDEQIDRISKILREMTDFSRPASYRKSLTHGNHVIQSALGISKYDRRLKGIQVITSLDSEIPALKLDGDQLLQVFLNIIFNAADAMNGDGTLTVISKLENHSVIVRFEDTGSGIPEELLSRVFEPFFTTKDVGKGTGLGLSVSYGIIQNMGGVIRASNRKEGGSVFTVEIPLEYSSEGAG